MSNPILTVDAATLKGWQDEVAAAEQTIAEGERRRMDAQRKLDAFAVLSGQAAPPSQTAAHANGSIASIFSGLGDEMNLTAAVETLAHGETPIPRPTLKAKLREQGFPEDRLSNYLYTVIARLKDKRRITVRLDGSLWKAPT